MSEIVNKVSDSLLQTLNLEDYYPTYPIIVFDIKEYLFMGLILKEKDFREALKNLPLENYTNKTVAITCSTDAIIPMWANMLIVACLQPVATAIYFGTEQQVKQQILLNNIAALPVDDFIDKRVVIKGCGELPITEAAYVEATKKLRPIAKSIMYGEPCSTVPIYKKKVV
jgi:hypothetical protein